MQDEEQNLELVDEYGKTQFELGSWDIVNDEQLSLANLILLWGGFVVFVAGGFFRREANLS